MLDNVVEVHGLPLDVQAREIEAKRRHGMGYFGLGSLFTMMGLVYGDRSSIEFTDEVTYVLAATGWEEGVSLAKEKGEAPILAQKHLVTKRMIAQRPELQSDGIKVGDMISGRILHAKYSRNMQKLTKRDPALIEEIFEHGARFTHHTSIAPTGTIALSVGNNASNGIEPSFSHQYSRNIIREGKKSKEKVDVMSYELLVYRSLIDPEASEVAGLPPAFVSADSIDPMSHVDIQAAAQQWIDASISKTINVSTDCDFDDFKGIYLYAQGKGLKGCTTFRFNPEAFQGVLVKESDLEATLYEFTLDDGSKLTLKGNDTVHYDNEDHTAANLFDAIKEKTYGVH